VTGADDARHRTRTLADLEAADLAGKRVMVRVDHNVPLDDHGQIVDPIRIQATLPTIRHLVEAGSVVLLVSHLGRPAGAPDPAATLAPVASWLAQALGHPVPLLKDTPGGGALAGAVEALRPGQVALLENIRFLPGETRGDEDLARSLASLAHGFVSDAFGAAHRAHASNVGVPRLLRERGGFAVAGYLMERELRFLRDALREPKRPFVSVMGGAKISGKIDLIEAILPEVDRLLVGGAMANTFLRALGLETGDSLVEEDRVEMARDLLERAGDRLLLPVDVVVARELSAQAQGLVRDRTEVQPGERIGDIGPRTRALFSEAIAGAGTVVWNGPMGIFEMPPFAGGTTEVAQALARATAGGTLSVVGGGDSAAAAEAVGVADQMSHISTGGGASLDLMAGRELPGVEVLERVSIHPGAADTRSARGTAPDGPAGSEPATGGREP
jgi:phosphoglycerate kinase